MENTASKTGDLRPMLLRVGLPLALSAVCGICSAIMARTAFKASCSEMKENLLKPKSKSKEREKFQGLNSAAALPLEEEEEGSEIQDQKPNIEEVILGLRSIAQDLERKELEIERQFICYQDLKERESLLVELRNTLLLDMAHISFLEREILSMEAENKRFESLVLEYLRVSEQLECEKKENKFLDREAKKLKKKLKEKSRVIREKTLKIEDSKEELWRTHDEMGAKKNVIEKLENEVRELQMQLNQLQKQENKASSNSKDEAERSVTIEEYNRLADEFRQLKDECSKQEILRNREQEEQNRKENQKEELQCEGKEEGRTHGLKQELNGKAADQNEPSSTRTIGDKTSFTRRKFLQKISCVGSNEKMKGKIRPEREA